jgi:TPR repeat protein
MKATDLLWILLFKFSVSSVSAEDPQWIELNKKAESGDNDAQTEVWLSEIYFINKWQPQRSKYTDTILKRIGPDEIKLYKIHATAGDIKAQIILSVAYATGSEKILKNGLESAKWAKLAANKGDSLGQRILGCYYKDHGDYENAYNFFLRSARQGDLLSQNFLAHLYLEGKGVPKNVLEAIKWFRISLLKGNLDAAKELGRIYSDGKYIEIDKLEAVKFYRLSVENGNSVSQIIVLQIELANFLSEVGSSNEDLMLAHAYMNIAHVLSQRPTDIREGLDGKPNGLLIEGTREGLKNIEKRMSNENKNRAMALAAEIYSKLQKGSTDVN